VPGVQLDEHDRRPAATRQQVHSPCLTFDMGAYGGPILVPMVRSRPTTPPPPVVGSELTLADAQEASGDDTATDAVRPCGGSAGD
jgi:hypothetical protein